MESWLIKTLVLSFLLFPTIQKHSVTGEAGFFDIYLLSTKEEKNIIIQSIVNIPSINLVIVCTVPMFYNTSTRG